MQARGIFFEEDDARAVARRLLSDGFDAEVVRERFAGEDDDEDQPWAVTTDAPTFLLEVLVDRHDGWLDDPGPHPAPYSAPDSAPHVAGPAGPADPSGRPHLPHPPRGPAAPLDLPDAPRRLKRPPV